MTRGATSRMPYQPRTFDEAFSHLFQPLCRFVRSRATALRDRVSLPEGAENVVVQRVFDAAFAIGWNTIRQPRTWLYVVAGHQLRLMADRQCAEPGLAQTVTLAATAAARTSVTEVCFAAIVAAYAVCELPDHRSQVSYLRWCERWSVTEIADALGISETATSAHSDGGLPPHSGRRDPNEAITLLVAAQAQSPTTLFAVHTPHRRGRRPRKPPTPYSALGALLLGVLGAASGLVLAPAWHPALRITSAVLTLTGTALGLRYLWSRRPRPDVDTHAAPHPSAPAHVLLLVIRFHRAVLAPLLPASCRFTPSCSAYAQQALTQHGAARGTVLALRRLARCRPGGPRGDDPVPTPAPRCSVPPCRVSWKARRRRRRIKL